MTVEIYPDLSGAGATDYLSKRFTVTVNGSPTWTFGVERTPVVGVWASLGAATVEHSWVKIGTNEAVTFVVVRKHHGTGVVIPITAFSVSSANGAATAAIVGGALIVSMPADTRAKIEVNGERGNILALFADPLKPAVPAGAVNWVSLGRPTTLAVNQKVFIPAGVVETVPGAVNSNREIRMANGAEVYIEGGAVLIGSFNFSNGGLPVNGAKVSGAGVVSGAFVAYPYVQALLVYSIQFTYAIFHTDYGVFGYFDNRVEGVTTTLAPFYTTSNGVCELTRAHQINPWWPNTDGTGGIAPKSLAEPRSDLTKCYLFAGDDCLLLDKSGVTVTVTECHLITSNGGSIHFGYYAMGLSALGTTVQDCALESFSPDYIPGFNPAGVIKWWCDGQEADRFDGRYNVILQRIRVYGPLYQRLFALVNVKYPMEVWGASSQEAAGSTANWLIDGLWVETLPPAKSLIYGRDRRNTLSNLAFRGVRIAGEQVSVYNFTDYFDLEQPLFQTCYHLFVEGKALTTYTELANLALGQLGDVPRVVSISPLDGSTQADLCATMIPQAIELTLGRHAWSFATRRSDLVEVVAGGNDQFPYCYEIPGGMQRLLAVLPPGVTDVVQGLQPARYAVESNGTTLRIYTVDPAATVVFTTYDVDTNAWPAEFKQATIYRLASMLAGPVLKGETGRRVARELLQLAEYEVARGAPPDASMRRAPVDHTIDWLAGRE
jgi:hypothetical protein